MKNKEKYTPGPWKLERQDEFSEAYSIFNESGQMAIATSHGFDTDESCKANALLIVSAPDQHESLTKLVGICEAILEDRASFLARPGTDERERLANERFFTHELNKHMAKLEDAYAEGVEAIKKATGE